MITKSLNSKSNIKQYSDADYPVNPRQPVIARYQADSTASQTVINLPFPVDTVNAQDAFFVSIDGKILTLGSSADYTMTAIDVLGFSSQVTLTSAIVAGLNIQAWKLGLKKESEFAQDQRFTNLYENMNSGFQGFVDQSVLMTPTTATGSPATGTFHSTVVGRASMVDLRQDLKPRMGVERIMTQRIMKLQDEIGPAGEPVYSVLNDSFNQIRFVGLWLEQYSATYGSYQFASITTDYVEITFYGTGLNMLLVSPTGRNWGVSIDGGSESTFTIASASDVLGNRNYAPNNLINLATGLTLGVHTLKLRNNAVGGSQLDISGFEILNESSSVKTNPGIGYIQGKKALLSAQASSLYNDVVTGTRGGRVLQYLSAAGVVSKAFQAVDASQLNLSSANHANEEVVRRYNYREFGAGRTDDFSRNATGAISKAFTLDDGTTTLTLTGNNVIVDNVGVGIDGSGGNGIVRFTFVGTGLDIYIIDSSGGSWGTHTISIDGGASIGNFGTGAVWNESWAKVVSGLPYGTHTVTITSSTGGTKYLHFTDFRVHQPKKPTLPSGAIELADYNVMADFIANATQSTDTVATGVLRKMASREFVYAGTWTLNFGPALLGGSQIFSSTTGDYLQYTFFGTGFDFRFNINTVASTWQFTLDGSTNLSGFTTSSYGASISSFTPATGTLVTTTTTADGSGIRVSGLTLGLHTVKLTKTAGTGQLYNEAFDIITPIHSAKSNLYVDTQNTLPVGSNAISDNRKATPVKEVLPLQKALVTSLGVTNNPTTNITSNFVPIPDMSIVFKKTGHGPIEINYSLSARNDTLGQISYFIIYLDGNILGQPRAFNQYVATHHVTITDSQIAHVSAGTHKIDVAWQVGGGTTTINALYRSLTVKEL